MLCRHIVVLTTYMKFLNPRRIEKECKAFLYILMHSLQFFDRLRSNFFNGEWKDV